jgi:hypothetical protein
MGDKGMIMTLLQTCVRDVSRHFGLCESGAKAESDAVVTSTTHVYTNDYDTS